MSNETLEQDQEMKEMEQQLEQAIAEEKAAKAVPETVPSPEPAPEPVTEAVATPEPTVTPQPSEPVEQPKADTAAKDDPKEWAEKKGIKSYEDALRALQQKEIEFHKRNQAGHPGYKDISDQPAAAPQPAPTWQPQPQWQPQFYQPQAPQYQPQPDVRQIAAQLFPEMNPDDAKVFIPAMLEVARTAARQERMALERQFGPQLGAIQRTADRNNELMSLMQDSAFRDPRVQKEVHAVLDADPSIFQRERNPYNAAYEKALANMTRKQLQQGVIQETNPKNTPPVTAGGGNGSVNTAPFKVTQEIFNSWTDAQQDAYMKSNGRVLPRK